MQRGKSVAFRIKVHIPTAIMTWMSTLISTFNFSNFIEHLLWGQAQEQMVCEQKRWDCLQSAYRLVACKQL